MHHTTRLVAGTAVALTLISSTLVFADDAPNPRIARVENGFLPTVALKEKVGERTNIRQRMDALAIPGASVAVIDDGKIIWARAYGVTDLVTKAPVTTATRFQAGSISKPLAALGALSLVKEGKLSLDEDVNVKLKSWHVPENEFTQNEKVTLRRILSHTAGLTVHGFPGYVVGEKIPSVVQVLNGEPPANTPAIKVDVVPGSLPRYSGGGYTVMQQLVIDVTGEPFETFMAERVLQTLGMKSSTYDQYPAQAIAQLRSSGHHNNGRRVPGNAHIYPKMAAAGLWTTPSDLARYVLYVQAAERGKTGPLLDASLAKQLITKQNNGQFGLGLQLFAGDASPTFGHNGVDEGFEAQMIGYVSHGKGAVIMANANNAYDFFMEFIDSVAREYAWPDRPTKQQRVAEKISEDILTRAPGKYELGVGFVGTLSARDGRLFFETPPGDRYEVFAKSETELFALVFGPASFTLVSDEGGKVTALRDDQGRKIKKLE